MANILARSWTRFSPFVRPNATVRELYGRAQAHVAASTTPDLLAFCDPTNSIQAIIIPERLIKAVDVGDPQIGTLRLSARWSEPRLEAWIREGQIAVSSLLDDRDAIAHAQQSGAEIIIVIDQNDWPVGIFVPDPTGYYSQQVPNMVSAPKVCTSAVGSHYVDKCPCSRHPQGTCASRNVSP